MAANKFLYQILICVVIVLLGSCSNTKNLPANDALYTGTKVTVEGPKLKKREKKELKAKLTALTRPKPNSKILGFRFKLWLWNIAGHPKKKNSPAAWIKKMGEAPVLLSSVNVTRNQQVLQNTLENSGYFRAQVTGDTIVKNKHAHGEYKALTGVQYTINEVKLPSDSSEISKEIARTKRNSLLKPKDPFDLEIVKTERERIDSRLKQHGYFFFDPNYLLFDVDSTIGNHKVNMFVNIKKDVSPLAKRVYHINKVFIYSNYTLNTTQIDTNKNDALLYSGYYVVDPQRFYKLKLFAAAMQFNPGDIYNRRDHNQTLNRLINLNIFKFVKNRFEPVGDSALDVYYYLTPQPRQALRVELGAETKSNNMTGSQITLGYTNRNIFRGGEIFSFKTTAGFEVQFSGKYKGYNTMRFGAEGNLAFPEFLVPFVRIQPRSGFVPRTNIKLGYDILVKQKLYTLNSFRAAYGYIWKESLQKEHTFYPISIQYVQPSNVTQEYKDSLKNDPTLQQAIDTQFIIGANYSYLYNQVLNKKPMDGLYWNPSIDVSGNIVGLFAGGDVKAGKQSRVLGAAYAQYLKLESDFRFYRALNKTDVWANRVLLGFGYPYGNSLQLPFVKQFFAGGNNSLRGFRSRSVGPGTYIPKADSSNFIPDQSGDIRIELNTELRFKMVSVVYGALFVDAGNIWLYNDWSEKPGAKFTNEFYKQIAVDVGLGIRLDISLFVLRLDMGIPIRKAVEMSSGNNEFRWVLNKFQPGDSQWRKNNLIFNLGIGYPF
jgi:outer membrane protein insertion porin family